MEASEKLFLQTVGRFIADRYKTWNAQLIERISALETEVRELRLQVRELEAGGVRFCGVYSRAQSYRRGDCCTHDGSWWCAVADAQPLEAPGKSTVWVLAVKRGRDAHAA